MCSRVCVFVCVLVCVCVCICVRESSVRRVQRDHSHPVPHSHRVPHSLPDGLPDCLPDCQKITQKKTQPSDGPLGEREGGGWSERDRGVVPYGHGRERAVQDRDYRPPPPLYASEVSGGRGDGRGGGEWRDLRGGRPQESLRRSPSGGREGPWAMDDRDREGGRDKDRDRGRDRDRDRDRPSGGVLAQVSTCFKASFAM